MCLRTPLKVSCTSGLDMLETSCFLQCLITVRCDGSRISESLTEVNAFIDQSCDDLCCTLQRLLKNIHIKPHELYTLWTCKVFWDSREGLMGGDLGLLAKGCLFLRKWGMSALITALFHLTALFFAPQNPYYRDVLSSQSQQ